MGVTLTAKAKMLHGRLVQFAASGVPEEYTHAAEQRRLQEVKRKEEEAAAAARAAAAAAEEEQRRKQAAEEADRKRKIASLLPPELASLPPAEAEEYAKRAELDKPVCHKYHEMPYVINDSSASAYPTWRCEICRKSCKDARGSVWAAGRYHCKGCQQDLCTGCYDSWEDRRPPHDTQGHKCLLTLNSRETPDAYRNGWHCSDCKKGETRSSTGNNMRFHCRSCQDDYCRSCTDKRR